MPCVGPPMADDLSPLWGLFSRVFYVELIMSGLVIAWMLSEQAKADRLNKQLAHARKCKSVD